MTRAVTIIGLFLTILIGAGTYWVSHEVERLEKHYAEIQSDILAEQESIHVLEAEWSYLNNPERIERLSREYLSLDQIQVLQMASIDDLPEVSDMHQYRIDKFGEAVAFMPTPRPRPGSRAYAEAAESMIVDAPSVATNTGGAQ
ncbi:cell division protein FtsL [Thalassospira sp. CH_XMU1448-2]|uniref:cell division protein FtsL n=1 Tax=Thalassospira sp. CH_XMU1448-2 TaxID=3107773 RepID=UPI00300A9E06